MAEVRVRLPAQRRHVLAVIGAGEALVVSDHVADGDAVTTAQPAHEAQARGHLRAVVQDLRIAVADVLDAYRGPVEPDGVAAHARARNPLMDRAGAAAAAVPGRVRTLALPP